jgi:hypothetical protein
MADRTVYVDGTTSGTPGTAGAHYATLDAAFEAEYAAAPDLVSAGAILHIECANISDTERAWTRTTNWVTDDTHYIHIYGKASDRTATNTGKWSTERYRLDVTDPSTGALYLGIDCRVENLQVKVTGSAGERHVVYIPSGNRDDMKVSISGCILVGNYSGSPSGANGILVDATGSSGNIILTATNNIIYNTGSAIAGMSGIATYSYSQSYHYNNTVYNYSVGIKSWGGAGYAKVVNNICNGCTDGFLHGDNDWDAGSDYNCSDIDSDAPGANSRNGTNGDVTFVNVTAGSEDFHLGATDANAKNYGSDLSAIFTTDIDGTTRPTGAGTWDIGADGYTYVGGLSALVFESTMVNEW